MKTQIVNKDNDILLVKWEDEELGFGELFMQWDKNLGKFVLDSEHLGVHTILKIIKAI